MMNERVFKNSKLTPEQVRTRQLILIISLIGLIATAILTLTAFVDKNVTETIINGSTAILLAISLVAAWYGSMGFGRLALPFTALVSISYLSVIGDGLYDPGNLAFAIVIAIAALLLGARGLIIFGALTVGSLFAIIFAGNLGIFPHRPASVPDIIAALMGFIVSTIILYLNARQLERSLNETRRSEQVQIQINQELLETKVSLEKQTQELELANELNTHRVQQLRLVAEVANSAASIQVLDRLLPTVSQLISQRFGVYHTGIFLLDNSREYAILRAASSVGGQKMLTRGYRLQVNEQGIVSSVIMTGNPRIALNVGMDAVYFDNPDLQDSHSEIGLPLKIAGETIGALDLQSVKTEAFGQEDIEVLSILANQLAIAIQNARSFESARQAVQDAETAYQQLTVETWSQIVKGQVMSGYHFDGVETRSINNEHEKTIGATLEVPVRLRGQEIGKIKLTPLGTDRIWTEDEIIMAESIAERAALSLENARLLQEAQRHAAKEQIIGEVSSKISSTINLDSILQTALRELGRILPGAEINIQVEND